MRITDLQDEVKEAVLDRYRHINTGYVEWFDDTVDDAKVIGELLGISIKNIYFSGFSSQGDGACFEGEYEYRKQSVSLVFGYAPKDAELKRIAHDLQELQRRYFYQLNASITKTSHHYQHENTVSIDVYHTENSDILENTQDDIAELMRNFMQWIYSQLEKQYDFLTSDEAVEETLEVNEYEFDIEGNDL